MNTSSPGGASAQPAAGGRSAAARNLQWLLANLVEEVPGVRSVAVISSDGLMLCSSEAEGARPPAPGAGGHDAPDGDGAAARPARPDGDLATVVSGLASLTDGAARLMEAGGSSSRSSPWTTAACSSCPSATVRCWACTPRRSAT